MPNDFIPMNPLLGPTGPVPPLLEPCSQEAMPIAATRALPAETIVEPPTLDHELLVRMEALQSAMADLTRLSRDQERIVDRLHSENQELRKGEAWQLLLPVFRDMVRLQDDLHGSMASVQMRDSVTPAEMAEVLATFRTTVVDILYRHGVEAVAVEPGEPFDPKLHTINSIRPVPFPERDRLIERMVRPGFKSDQRTVRLPLVDVYRYEAPTLPTPDQQIP